MAVLQNLLTGGLKRHPRLLWQLLIERDTLRFATFFGLMIGSFKAVLCGMRRYRKQDDGWNSAVAGAVSGLALLIDERQRRIVIALYMSCRAMQFVHQKLLKERMVPAIPHGETLLMALCNTQILYSWMCYPETMNRSYYEWIYNLADVQYFHGAKDARVVKAVYGQMAKQQPYTDPMALNRVMQKSSEIWRAAGQSVPHTHQLC